MVLLLQSGRCYEAETCTILSPLRCAIAWYSFLLKSKFSDSGQQPWTIIRRFAKIELIFCVLFTPKVEGATYEAEICTICSP